MLTFGSKGREDFYTRIADFILKEPSVQAPNRKHRLQTFSERNTKNTKKVSQLDKDKQLVLSAIKKKLQHSKKKTGAPIEQSGEQLIEYPLSICDNEGKALKGNKSYTTNVFEQCYKTAQPSVVTPSCPIQPTCTIIDVNTALLGIHRTMADYAHFIERRHILPHNGWVSYSG